MKVILTGATGTVGGAVLAQAISSPAITLVVVLTRRPLDTIVSSPKVKVLLVQDFMSYSPATLAECDGAEACIWCLGGTPDKYPDLRTAETVNIEYPYTAALALASRISETPSKSDMLLQFWYVSGRAAVRDQNASLRLFADARKIKGQAENRLLEVESKYAHIISMHFARVGSVIPNNSLALKAIATLASPWYPAIAADAFAVAMVEGVLHGDAKQVVTHEDLVMRTNIVARS